MAASSGAAEQRIGLVLGGGGARGAAHIGVLKVLERERIPIHAIAGTSIGAIVGGLYASGYSPDEMEQIMGSVDWFEVFQDASARELWPMRQKETDVGNVANLEFGHADGRFTLPNSLVKGQKLGLLLRQLFLGHGHMSSFDDLPIPFRAVATDIGTVERVVFESGDLSLAVRASMSLPATFAPVHHDGKVLVDGGLVDNLPVEVARQMGVDRLIVVDVGSGLAHGAEVDSILAVLHQVIAGLMRDHSEATLKLISDTDVYIRPDLTGITTMGFDHALRGIGPGQQAAEAVVERLRAFAVPEPAWQAWRAHQRNRFAPDPEISFVEVDATRSGTAQLVRDRITAKTGEPLDRQALERDIASAYGRGEYESISYRLKKDEDGRTGLEVLPVDSALGRTVFRVGLQVNDDFSGSSDYQFNAEARLTGLTTQGGEWRSVLGAGRETSLATELYLPFGRRGDWFVRPEAYYSALNQPIEFEDATIAQYRVGTIGGLLHLGRNLGDRMRLSAGVLRARDSARRKVALSLFPRTIVTDLGGFTSTALWDSLDSVKFPQRGLRAEVSYSIYEPALGADEAGNLLRISIDKPFGSGPNTLMLGARASLSSRDPGAFSTEATLGGLTFLSGLGDRELINSQMLLLRGIYYRRITQAGGLIDLPVYLAGSIEAGNVWTRQAEVSLGDLMGAASVFLGMDLPIGPLQLGYGRTSRGQQSFYLTFGSLVLPRYR